tara:strand:- start:196 stop:546 length:351 start_codon:yes stop_codon:yes gene_type:complete
MKKLKITKLQNLVNRVNSKIDFTYNLDPSLEQKNYVVSIKNIYTGKNPSLFFNMNIELKKAIDSKIFDSIGLWNNKGRIYVDANVHFYSLDIALAIARKYNQISIFDINNNKIINL